VIILQRQPDLLEVVFAARSPGSFTGLLHGRQQECDKNGDNGNDNEQLDERKSASTQRHGRAFRESEEI
jgi:hypothetical protein